MNAVFKSFVLAFSKYSISPKARVKKNEEESAQFILLFVPLIIFQALCENIRRGAGPNIVQGIIFRNK